MRVGHFAAAVFAAAFVSGEAEAQTRRFDGYWTVQAVTERGTCDRVFNWPVIISYGRVRYGGAEPVAISGGIAGNGAVSGALAYGQVRANMRGRLSGYAGGGSWIAGVCAGRWYARRTG